MRKRIKLITFNLGNLSNKAIKKIRKKNTYLIGNWCKETKNLYQEKTDTKILNFYNWDKLKEKTEDIKYILSVYNKLLVKLTKNLNSIHKTKYNKKYWEFLINRWLMAFIVDIYSKWRIADYLLQKYDVKEFLYQDLKDKMFLPENTFHHHYMHGTQSSFTHWCLRKIFKYRVKNLNEKKIKISNLSKIKKTISKCKFKMYKTNIFNLSLFKKIFLYELSFDKKIYFYLKFKNFFINLPYKNEAISFNKNFNNKNLRKDFFNLFKNSKKGFEDFLIKHMYHSMPKIFLENYAALHNCYLTLNWPKQPEFILTTYGHYYDEIFKIYCANKIIKKTKLFIFQHGDGGYFADDDFYNIGWDKKLCNKYFVWGKHPKKGCKAFFYTKKYLDQTPTFYSSINGKVLLIVYGFIALPFKPPHGFIDTHEKNKIITFNTVDFVNSLKKNIKNKVDIKLLDGSVDKVVKKSIKYKLKKYKIYDEKRSLLNNLKNYNLTIHFYLSTPFFETILFNKPTILIFNKKIQYNYDKNFYLFMKRFYENKIAFTSIREAVLFVNENFNNLESWWNNKKVQKIREDFCETYCRNFKTNSDFKEIFK